MSQSSGRLPRRTARLLSLLMPVAGLLVPAASVAAYERPVPEVPIQPCSKYSSPTGDDANPGTRAAPKLTLTALSQSLQPGQTGCVQDGSTTVLTDTVNSANQARISGGTAGNPKIIRPETVGARATFTNSGKFYIDMNQSDVILKDLTFIKTVAGSGSAWLMDGDRVTFDGVDISYPDNICLDVGGDPRSINPPADSADDFVLINSRIHDCGLNHINDPADPGGAHGLYLEYVRDGADADSWGAIIHNSVFDHNKDRGIQLYPDVDDALIDQVVIFSNGSNLNIGSETNGPGDPLAVRSDRAVVRNSIIGDSRLDAYDPGNANITATADILGNFAHGVGNGADNVVRDSCLYNTERNDHLFEVTGNDLSALRLEDMTLNQPAVFEDADAGDFRLTALSPCQGMGLADASLLPGAGLPPAATYRPDASIVTDTGVVGSGIVNPTGESQTVDVVVPAGSSRTISLAVANAGNTTDTFGLAEARSGQYEAFTRTWTHDGVDVTDQLAPAVGWHMVADLAPGARETLTLTVGVPVGTPAGLTAGHALHVYHSPKSAEVKDVVIVNVTSAPQVTDPTPTPPVPPVAVPVPVPAPEISSFALTSAIIRARGPKKATRTKATIVLTADARVRLTFKRKGKKTLSLTLRLTSGRNTFFIASKLTRKKRLTPGTWRIAARATNADGSSALKHVRLRVKR